MNDDSRSLTTLVGDLAEQASTLIRTEARLLRTELSEKFSKMGTSAIEVVADHMAGRRG